MKNQFISKSTRAEKFNKMVQRIGDITEIDIKFIRKSCEKACNEWEEKNNKEMKTLFNVSNRVKSDEIAKIIKTFQRSLGGKIESNLIMNKVGTIAEFWLKDLYISF
ncbi:MAG: hypothetical protein ACTSVZ_01785 [Promethearchaeota archaeon]